MKLLCVLAGIPGSGKTTMANSLLRADPASYPIAVRYSADDYFTNAVTGKYSFDAAKLPDAHGQCLRNVIDAMRDRDDLIVVDNTNTTAVEIAPYMALAQAYGYTATIRRLLADPAVCAARNVHGVSLEACKRMDQRLRRAEYMPWWDVFTTEGTS